MSREAGQEAGDRVVELEAPFLVQHHDRDARSAAWSSSRCARWCRAPSGCRARGRRARARAATRSARGASPASAARRACRPRRGAASRPRRGQPPRGQADVFGPHAFDRIHRVPPADDCRSAPQVVAADPENRGTREGRPMVARDIGVDEFVLRDVAPQVIDGPAGRRSCRASAAGYRRRTAAHAASGRSGQLLLRGRRPARRGTRPAVSAR